MDEMKNCIGYCKTIQRTIASGVFEGLATGEIVENTDKYRAAVVMYGQASLLRTLMQIYEDDDYGLFFEYLTSKTPGPAE